jgi:hypothetical protein
MKQGISICITALLCLPGVYAQSQSGEPAATTVTGVTGTISQVNYGTDGAIEGFLIGTTTLLNFPTNVSGGIGTLGVSGNSVTYSGTEVTTSAGFSSVRVTSYTNNTTKITYSSSTTVSTAAAYGPTSGAVKQLNYGNDGTIESFIFTPASTTPLLVVTGSGADATLKPLLLVGATVSVTGTEQAAAPTSACVASGVLTVVQASSLIISGQTIVITGVGNGGNGGFGGGPGPGHH